MGDGDPCGDADPAAGPDVGDQAGPEVAFGEVAVAEDVAPPEPDPPDDVPRVAVGAALTVAPPPVRPPPDDGPDDGDAVCPDEAVGPSLADAVADADGFDAGPVDAPPGCVVRAGLEPEAVGPAVLDPDPPLDRPLGCALSAGPEEPAEFPTVKIAAAGRPTGVPRADSCTIQAYRPSGRRTDGDSSMPEATLPVTAIAMLPLSSVV